jgi:hypothetical protein
MERPPKHVTEVTDVTGKEKPHPLNGTPGLSKNSSACKDEEYYRYGTVTD